jgi:hypothetical protein
MHSPRLAGELEIGAQVFHWLFAPGQSAMPPSSLRLHPNPWSGNPVVGVLVPPSQQVERHSEPEGPLPTVDAAVTQQVVPASLPAQSDALVQDTHTGLEQILGSGLMHKLTEGQQTYG